MTIKNTINSAIDYFYMGAPAATVSMKLDSDLQTKLIADGLCRISGAYLDKGLKYVKVGTPCMRGCGGQNRTFIVSLGRQANYPRRVIGYTKIIESILWLDDQNFGYGSF